MIRFLPRAALAATFAITMGLLGFAAAHAQSPQVPTTSPTPTASPADPQFAAEFASEGRVDAAAGAYLAVIDQGTAAERLAARLALARVYLDDARPVFAAIQLEGYLLEALPGADVRDAQYLLAEALDAQGRYSDALPLYDRYIQSGGGASLYARVARAQALLYVGRAADAMVSAETLLNEVLPRGVRLGLIAAMARGLEEDSPADAIAWYDRLRDESSSPNDQAMSLWRSALIQRDLGDNTAWNDAALTIIERYPGTPTAIDVIEDFPPVNVALDGYVFGLAYYLNGRSEDARGVFETLLASGQATPNAARAAFYVAVLDEREGNNAGAIDQYARSFAIDPTTELADDALWWRGRLLESEGRVDEARNDYQQLVREQSTSSYGIEARFRLGLLDYDAEQFDAAASAFAAIARDSSGGLRERALLWQGKTFAAQDNAARAEAVWRGLLQEAPEDYYGLRAGVLLGETDGGASSADLDEPAATDWGAIASWVRASSDADLAAALDDLLFNSHWGLAQELRALGQGRDASSELNALLEDAGSDPAALYTLLRYTAPRGADDISARAAARLLNVVPDRAQESAPLDLWRLAYPAPQPELLEASLAGTDVPNLLMLALVRQESFFDPLAGSSAGALGLTQVVPPTGEEIAADLGVRDFAVDDLFFPSVALEFGAHYLDKQLALFDGNVYEALAAYNAGPGNAQRWAAVANGDIDRFVEEIEFGQTDAYVKLVSDNLSRYRQLYLGLAAPALPED